MTYAVEVAGLCKSFGDRPVLSGVDLVQEQGTVLALLGPNGAGKTTLVRILATLLRPDAGRAVVAGHDVVAEAEAVKRSISLTGQFAAVDQVLTARENLTMMAELRRVPRRAAARRVDELLHRFELHDAADRRVATYSGGMVRRLDLAMSLVTRPKLLFLDEPTTGLDPHSREQLWGVVRALRDDGVSILLTTQYLDEADALADRVVVLDRGRIIAAGSADELKAEIGAEVLRLQFDEAADADAAAEILAAAVVEVGVVEVTTDGTADQLHDVLDRLLRAGLRANRVAIHRPSLDDVFFALTTEVVA